MAVSWRGRIGIRDAKFDRAVIRFELFGYRFQVEPAAPSSPELRAADMRSSTIATQVSLTAKRILIVDDDPVFLKTTGLQLTAAGFRVATAQTSSDAVAVLAEQAADVIVLDLEFPVDTAHRGMGTWDGFQPLSWLRGLPSTRGARFIIVSASDSPATRHRALQLGAVAYFPKPLSPRQLIAAINAVKTDRIRLSF